MNTERKLKNKIKKLEEELSKKQRLINDVPLLIGDTLGRVQSEKHELKAKVDLLEAKKQKYLEDYHYCPFCSSDKINTRRPLKREGTEVSHTVSCMKCENIWTDIYTLNNVVIGREK